MSFAPQAGARVGARLRQGRERVRVGALFALLMAAGLASEAGEHRTGWTPVAAAGGGGPSAASLVAYIQAWYAHSSLLASEPPALGLARSANLFGTLAARPLSHFPVHVDGAVQGSVAIADLTGDGSRELVLAAGPAVTALRRDNSLVHGFPVYLDDTAAGSVAVADLSGEGQGVVLVVTSRGEAHLLRADGSSWPGFPVSVGEGARAGGSLVDLTGDGRREVVAGGACGHLHVLRVLESGPEIVSGFPVKLGGEITSTPSLADLGGRDLAEPTLLVGSSDGALHALDPNGRPRPGFPVRSRFLISGQPASADISGDGVADVVFTSQDYNLYVVDASGRALPGFPVQAGYRIYGAPALVDLDGDGSLEIAFAAADRKLYAVDRRGSLVSGFPAALTSKPVGSVVAGDIFRDGRQVLLVATDDGRIHAHDAEGRSLEGWPMAIDGPPSAGPSLADVVGDGYVEMVIGTRDARVVALKARRLAEAPRHLFWATEGHDPARSGWLHPNRARFHDLAVVPASPMSTDSLSAVWTWRHLDRVDEGAVDVRWFRDGEEVLDLRGKREVPSETLRRGESWRFTVRSKDEGARALLFESSPVGVRNAPPTRPVVRLLPEEPTVGVSLVAAVEEPSSDPDGDPVEYLYRWYRDEELVGLPEDTAAVPEGTVRKGEVWRVEVRPFDGHDEGPAAEAMTAILNTPPTRPKVSLQPPRPLVTDEIHVRVEQEAVDSDGDELVKRHRWRMDGEPAPFDESVSVLPAGTAAKGQTVLVEVCAFDGEEEGPAGEASVVVVNPPPAAPKVAIEPSVPRTNDELRAVIREPSEDPDGDEIGYAFRWLLDGEDTGLVEDVVDAERVRAGQSWVVEVQAHDDEGPGGAARAEVRVVNTPPRPPVVVIMPDDPLPEEPLEALVLSPATDRDGDEVGLTYVFSAEGRDALQGPRLPEGLTRKGELWTLTVTPHDGTEAGEPAQASVRIGNRPPPTPSVRVEPVEPTGGSLLTAVAPIPEDPDGDDVSLSVRWTVDGNPVSRLDDRLEVPGEMVRRDQVWMVRVRATDGEAWSGTASDTVRVLRSPPVAPVLVVEPQGPVTTDELRCVARRQARHPDGDPMETSLLWYRDGERTAHSGEKLPSNATRRGERWACRGRVVALSGVVLGDGSEEVVIRNSKPTRPRVAIDPASPRLGDALGCGLTRPSFDADGDEVEYSWSWTRDGVEVPDIDGSLVPEGRVRRGERWGCTVVPRDPFEAGPAAEAVVEVGNTPPTAPVVSLAPAGAGAGDDLLCEILEPAVDPDGGEVSYVFRWYMNGEPQPFPPTATSVRGRLVEAGSTWRCGVKAHDGIEAGAEGRSQLVEIGQ